MSEKKKVAIIDDDPNIVEIYGTKLKNDGYEVVSSLDGESGISLIKKENPDVILLDIMMPKKDGVAVLRELKNHPKTYHIPVIVLSNASDQEVVEKISEFSTNFYAIKSLSDPQKISGLVKETLYGEK